MQVIHTTEVDKNIISEFFEKHWGSSEMVISSGIFQCDTLDGLAVLNEEELIIGLLTYIIEKNVCEIISLDSIEKGKGIGTSLLDTVEQMAKENGCEYMKIITTNDNLHALGFYQKRGYQLIQVIPDAVEKARQVKSEIPFIADNGIPIRDEIVIEKSL
ncbi:GNAT family N-acetyltransferase [Bacillus solimangrovi]|uniref:GNAT family N-acetyltransferase n=1 Tax=Bacillus solimangrovi TaxID=1305675 RepID=A0A1E5LHJ1_9BACI|nr:GNAT family N-acetyltransferase [Bacillus solimangrovi]OEH93549.1 GNAT family N-acetyltransferase [Bacillus solimangrovi]